MLHFANNVVIPYVLATVYFSLPSSGTLPHPFFSFPCPTLFPPSILKITKNSTLKVFFYMGECNTIC